LARLSWMMGYLAKGVFGKDGVPTWLTAKWCKRFSVPRPASS
jgi:hypothetical protein